MKNAQKYLIAIIFGLVLLAGLAYFYYAGQNRAAGQQAAQKSGSPQPSPSGQETSNPLDIVFMRQENYPGSDLTIEQKLSPGSNYDQYIASYRSEGFKIYGLLTIPRGAKPAAGWPVIIFNHGYIQPNLYKTTGNYVAYVAALARSGYIVFKPDYRGNGNSEGQPDGPYYSPGYAVDVLNAVATLKNYKDSNPEKIGMWGHSMGGNIALRSIVVDAKDIKAAVIWGGVVGSYADLIYNWQSKVKYRPNPEDLFLRNNHRQQFLDRYGTPTSSPAFWNAMDPTYFVPDITAPVQLHTGGSDEEVPVAFSVELKDLLAQAGKTVEYYNYPGGNHNISSPDFEPAMRRTIQFFDKYLK